MISESSELKRFAHSVGQNWYHVVLIPKSRYPVFAQEHQRDLAIKAIGWICSRHSIEIYAKEVMDDHVHLFISCPPDYSIRKLVQIIKGGTSYYIRSHHPSLKKYKAFWSKGFMYRSVGNVSAKIVERYIKFSNNWISSKQKKLV
jgi:putative transposase